MAFRDAEARQNRIFKKEIERVQNDTKKMKEMWRDRSRESRKLRRS